MVKENLMVKFVNSENRIFIKTFQNVPSNVCCVQSSSHFMVFRRTNKAVKVKNNLTLNFVVVMCFCIIDFVNPVLIFLNTSGKISTSVGHQIMYRHPSSTMVSPTMALEYLWFIFNNLLHNL